jgi:hypothetical protein
MAWFGINITEFRSVHDDLHISNRLEHLSRQLQHYDREFESTPCAHVRKRFDILRRQHEILIETAHLDFIRRIRIEGHYKEMLKQLESTYHESKKKFSEYQRYVEKQFKDSATIKNFRPEQLVELKKQHDEAKRKLVEFHKNISGLTADLHKFKDTVRSGSKLDLRGGKAVYYNS